MAMICKISRFLRCTPTGTSNTALEVVLRCEYRNWLTIQRYVILWVKSIQLIFFHQKDSTDIDNKDSNWDIQQEKVISDFPNKLKRLNKLHTEISRRGMRWDGYQSRSIPEHVKRQSDIPRPNEKGPLAHTNLLFNEHVPFLFGCANKLEQKHLLPLVCARVCFSTIEKGLASSRQSEFQFCVA